MSSMNNNTLYEKMKADLVRSTEATEENILETAANTEARLLKRLNETASRADVVRSTEVLEDHILDTTARTNANVDSWGKRILKSIGTETWSVLQLVIVILTTVAGFFVGHMFFGYLVESEVRPFAKVTSSVTKAVADNAGNIKYYKDFPDYGADPVMRIITIAFTMILAFLLTIVVIDIVKHVRVRRKE